MEPFGCDNMVFVEQMGPLIASYEAALAKKARVEGKRKEREVRSGQERDVLQLRQLRATPKWSLVRCVSNTLASNASISPKVGGSKL